LSIADIILNRRTIHTFKKEKVPDTLIEEALRISRWAPNHYLTQPWRFYLLGHQAKSKIIEVNSTLITCAKGEHVAAIKSRRWSAVPGWLVMTVLKSHDEKKQLEDYAACCCVAQNFMLYLWEQGVGVKWTTGEVVSTIEFAQAAGFDSDAERPVGLFWYGFPEQVGTQMRKPLEDSLRHVL
jgi:nitroreductase